MVERYAHVAPETLQHTATRLDAISSCVLAAAKENGLGFLA
jgi:hypothetical protein